ncbi:HXXXD-type acyl-transferase family protein [Striga hermonthica]|uniref:HXXXD-type acyl-transferase family protein n=1 Tax=Striga hermonthica TaxID=68872 RepID=A0A9N7MH46_STRHE|nr:HXXXD-type acyl-transferase family protein [Striga hermonthica]
MNAGDVELISKSILKPSSPTPQTHKTLKLSFFDQLVPPFYVPVIFFYPADKTRSPALAKTSDPAHISHRLKQSFSHALSLFSALAGKLDPENPAAVQCCDAGARFIETRVHAHLTDAIKDPDMENLIKYLPADPHSVIHESSLLAVQINFFDCGGIALGVCSSHQVTDGSSLVAFMLTWAEICLRGGQGQDRKFPQRAEFDLARHFPPRDPSDPGFSHSIYLKKENLVTKRLVFDREKLAALRRRAATRSGSKKVDHPTRVELVSAYIWKNVIEIGLAKNIQLSAAWHVLNLRPRVTSCKLKNVFGNCIMKKYIYSEGGGEPVFRNLVSKMGKGLREIDEEYVRKAGDGGYLDDLSKYFDLVGSGKIETCGFSSWCRFPVYDVDFGWGKPEWVCPASCPEKNFSFMMGAKDGEGIELWINMLESSYMHLENKFKLLGKEEI